MNFLRFMFMMCRKSCFGRVLILRHFCILIYVHMCFYIYFHVNRQIILGHRLYKNVKECFDTILQLMWLIPSILQVATQNTQIVFSTHLILYWSRGNFVQLAINLNLLSVSVIMVSCKICKVGTACYTENLL